ncbi:hypothetical protein FOB58_002635 [Candida parapsilosis]|uniref:Opaque-phase-specific protein OP4 n=2 Tax=Candida parapsilosis TaxID=5480 RepID=G8B8B3_CANPC|nr:uncharacterized protein CPAR2_107330 [Candida parapsilosis]KAF6043064.1 hypothetical protein FOB59_005147 [Candida parapsilosis]KAF6049358.1 hypothetical protein FOB58_002635 [Candida parapsilosis]KAF6057209.1 hypothetical protein FOB60_001764 [Candida parapsilosis]KAF6066072.1 hypothetical protein FOB61_002142 [Candida parapsilosis]KAI5904363.1 hypothetical protein K4G60_g3521 [Candida parapsilosis]
MKFTASTMATVLAATASAATIDQQKSNLVARQDVERALSSLPGKFAAVKRDGEPDLAALSAHIDNYRAKRDAIDMEIIKRDYAIVTDVLTAINQSQLAPKILEYFVTNETFEPIIVNVLIAVMKSGLISLESVLNALVSSNLAVNVINDLISDCSLYAELFNAAAEVISNLAEKVEEKISEGVSSLITRDVNDNSLEAFIANVDKRDLDDVVNNLLDSLYKSGLATSVVKDVLTNSAYIPFATDLIKAMLANNLIDLGSIISALKQSGLITQLFQEFFKWDTLQTVAETAFAALAGECSGSSSGGSGGTSTPSTGNGGSGTGSGSGSVTSNVGSADPCKKRRRVRRRRRSNY